MVKICIFYKITPTIVEKDTNLKEIKKIIFYIFFWVYFTWCCLLSLELCIVFVTRMSNFDAFQGEVFCYTEECTIIFRSNCWDKCKHSLRWCVSIKVVNAIVGNTAEVHILKTKKFKKKSAIKPLLVHEKISIKIHDYRTVGPLRYMIKRSTVIDL